MDSLSLPIVDGKAPSPEKESKTFVKCTFGQSRHALLITALFEGLCIIVVGMRYFSSVLGNLWRY